MTEDNELASKLIRLGAIEIGKELESTDSGVPDNELMHLGFIFQRFGIKSAEELQTFLESVDKFLESQKRHSEGLKDKLDELADTKGRSFL